MKKLRKLQSKKGCFPCSYMGSITVETAMVLPIFFFAGLFLAFFIQILVIRTQVHGSLHYALKKEAFEMAKIEIPVPERVKGNVIAGVGGNRMSESLGSLGDMDIKQAALTPEKVLKVRASYQIKLPLPYFGVFWGRKKDEMKLKVWTGFEGNQTEENKQEMVYITEYGVVYHKDYSCTYLHPQIRKASLSDVKGLRNESGGRYYPCAYCKKIKGGTHGVFITKEGNRYHTSMGCSEIKRTIYKVPLADVAGRGVCKKCGGKWKLE